MKKGVLTTILTIQLILLVLLTFSQLQAEREYFEFEHQHQIISSYRISSNFFDIKSDINYMQEKEVTNDTMDNYINLIDSTYTKLFFSEIYLNESYINIYDENMGINKEGYI